jgi:hypothetical protein
MKAVEFAYWLQGYFEIKGGDAPFSNAQAQQVLEKAKAVKAENGPAETQAHSFADYAKGLLFPVSVEEQSDRFLAAATKELKTKLHDLFVHAIDPSVPGDQEPLRQTHRPDNGKPRIETLC